MPTSENPLFSPYQLGELTLKNRFVMAAMTRSRALPGNVQNPLAAQYYVQRASAGLQITEGTQVSPQGIGYVRTPGIHDDAQVAAWRHVTDAVHAAGGVIFAQLWHVGRISHPEFHGGEPPVAPSAITPSGQVFTSQGRVAMVTPRALETHEIPGIVDQFRRAAVHAKNAGFDGVELHGANGYLLDQFLRDGSNQRTDEYGGSLERRARFPLEVTEAVASVWGAARVGYKLAPWYSNAGNPDSNPPAMATHLIERLGQLRLGFIEIAEAVAGPFAPPSPAERLMPTLKRTFGGTLIANGGYEGATAEALLRAGDADLVSFARPFLANPDLPERVRRSAPLNPPDVATFYTGEERGYTDYPFLP